MQKIVCSLYLVACTVLILPANLSYGQEADLDGDAPENERQIDLEEMIAEASDGDREERAAIQVIDGEFDPVRDRPAFLDRGNER